MKNVQNFIKSLKLSGENLLLANVLLKTEQQCKDFYIGFLWRNKDIIDDLLDYREKRLAMSDINLDKFLWLCDNNNRRQVFEDVFLQPVTLADMALINESMAVGKLSLSSIYNRFLQNMNENILRNVL